MVLFWTRGDRGEDGDVSRWVQFELSGSANFGPIRSKLDRSIADVVVVAVAWSAAVGALSWRSMVLFWTSLVDAVTGGVGWKGSSGELSDDRRSPRLVAWAALKQEVGVLVKGEGENESYLVLARLFGWFFG